MLESASIAHLGWVCITASCKLPIHVGSQSGTCARRSCGQQKQQDSRNRCHQCRRMEEVKSTSVVNVTHPAISLAARLTGLVTYNAGLVPKRQKAVPRCCSCEERKQKTNAQAQIKSNRLKSQSTKDSTMFWFIMQSEMEYHRENQSWDAVTDAEYSVDCFRKGRNLGPEILAGL